jgi:RNA polymerase sigma factor (sigma-70 family)
MSLDAVPDEDLVAEYRRASPTDRPTIANSLFARHYERVGRWCYRIVGEREAAADLAQDVFIKALRHLDSFKGSSKFTTWLYVIARNEGFNRRQRPSLATLGDEALANVADEAEAVDHVLERASRDQRLHALLAEHLDRTEQTVFTLHYGNDMTLDAITRLLRLENASGAKAYIVSARRKLARVAEKLHRRGESL